MQDLNRGDCGYYSGLLVADTGSMGAIAVNTEWTPGRGSGAEHRIDMRDDEYFSFASSVKHRHEIVRQSGSFGRFCADIGAERDETWRERGLHLGTAIDVASARIDVH